MKKKCVNLSITEKLMHYTQGPETHLLVWALGKSGERAKATTSVLIPRHARPLYPTLHTLCHALHSWHCIKTCWWISKNSYPIATAAFCTQTVEDWRWLKRTYQGFLWARTTLERCTMPLLSKEGKDVQHGSKKKKDCMLEKLCQQSLNEKSPERACSSL